MRRLAALFAGVLAGAAAFAAHAGSPPFNFLRQLCVETHADRNAVISAAAAQGFVTASDAVKQSLSGFPAEERDAVTLAKPGEENGYTIVLNKHTFSLGSGAVQGDFCFVVSPLRDASAIAELPQWAGVEKAAGGTNAAFYAFSGEPGRRRSLAKLSDEAIKQAIAEGDVQVAGYMDWEGRTILVYGVFPH